MGSLQSYLINRETAAHAVRLTQPLIDAAMESREAGASGFLYVVVMKPGVTPANASFEEAILYEGPVFGDSSKWDADYGAFARAKAQVSWKTGMSCHYAQQFMPHLLAEGDSLLRGGIVMDGIVVAISGADPWCDEAIAGTIACFLSALAKKGVAERSKALTLGPV